MSYHNIIFDVSGPPVTFWDKIKFILSHILRKLRKPYYRVSARIKLKLRETGIRVGFSSRELQYGGLYKTPTAIWSFEDNSQPSESEISRRVEEEILPWLHSVIMRAPNPGGLDEQAFGLKICRNAVLVTRQYRMVDKYGWRKEGKEDTRVWLKDQLSTQGEGKIEVKSFVVGIGRLLAAYGLGPKYKLPSIDDIENKFFKN